MTDEDKFEVHCDASKAGNLHARTNSVSVRIGQRVHRNGTTEFWDSIVIVCQETQPGTLSAKLIVCHPDWDQHLQIANIESRATETNPSAPPLEIDLKPTYI